MPALPLPFITAIMLVLMLATLWRRNSPARRPACGFIALCLLMAVLVGLRWSSGFQAVRLLQPLVASVMPVFAWRCFSVLTEKSRRRFIVALMLAPAAAALLRFGPIAPLSVDSYIALLFLGYGGALIRLAAGGPDVFPLSRLGETVSVQQAAGFAGAILCGSGLIDLLVAFDFSLFAGRHAAAAVAGGQLTVMVALAVAIIVADRSSPASAALLPPAVSPIPAALLVPAASPAASPLSRASAASSPMTEAPAQAASDDDDDQQICRQVEQLLADKQLYCDPDLTLERLARKALIPGRRISRAVNRLQGRNVSQLINRYRVAKAQQLLLTTGLSVTEVMLESGFRTKSNFNREFLRLSHLNPGEYRKAGQPADPHRLRVEAASQPEKR